MGLKSKKKKKKRKEEISKVLFVLIYFKKLPVCI